MGWAILAIATFAAACTSRTEATCYFGSDCGDASVVQLDASEPVTPEPTPADAGLDAGAPEEDASMGLGGISRQYVIDDLDLGVLVGGRVAGFDIDGRVSDIDDALGCSRLDLVSPEPDAEEGVDNVLGPALADQEGMLGVRAGMADNVADGDLIVLLRVTDIDDWENDDAIEVHIFFGLLPPGVSAPTEGAGGGYAPGQTFDVDRHSFVDGTVPPGEPSVRLPGRIVGGRVQAGPGSIRMRIPWSGTLVEFDVTQSELRFDIAEGGLGRGVLGGALEVESTLDALEDAMPPQYNATLGEILFRGIADLFPNADNICQAVSVGLVFSGTTADFGVIR